MPVRIGFVGAGGIASAHMNALQAVDDAQIVAVADIDRDRAESAASRSVAKAYSDYREMLETEKLDAMYVCVPPFAHEDQELMAAERGIHLFVEKPVALTMDKARQVRDAVAKSGIVNSVGYHWRYQTSTERALQVLKGRKVAMALGYWMGGFPGVYWWRRMEQSGGQIVEQTTHIFDLARYLCGAVTEVYAACANVTMGDVKDFDVYDVGTVTLQFAKGAIGTISNTCALSLPYTVGLHVITKDLILEIGGDMRIIEPGHTEVFTGGANPILEENKAFIAAVRSGDASDIRSTYADAVKTLAVTLACNESAKLGEPVKVAD